MRKLCSILLIFALVTGEMAPAWAAARPAGEDSLTREVRKQVDNQPQAVYQRFMDRVNLFLSDEEPEDSAAEAPLSAKDEDLFRAEMEKLIKEIYEDWKRLHKMSQYKQEADESWLILSVLLLQQDNWLDFFGGEQNFRKKWFAPLANFYASMVNGNIVTLDAEQMPQDVEQRVYLSGLALQNLAAFEVQGYPIKKQYWESLAQKAVLSLQSALVVELVFPILIKNKSWKALDQAMTKAETYEWSDKSSAFWSALNTAISGAGIIGVPSLLKQKIDNFDAEQDRVFGAVSQLASVGWSLSSVKYSPTVTRDIYKIVLPGAYYGRGSGEKTFWIGVEKRSVEGRESIACRSDRNGSPNIVSLSGTKVWVFDRLPDDAAQNGLKFSDGIPLEKSKYANRSRDVLAQMSKIDRAREDGSHGVTELGGVEVVLNKKTGQTSSSAAGKAEAAPRGAFSTSWMDFAAMLYKVKPDLLKKHTADRFDADGSPASDKFMWPLVWGYLLAKGETAGNTAGKEFRMAQYFSRKTWADLPITAEEDLDFRMVYAYPQLACYAASGTRESDSSRQYIMVTPDRVRAGIGARWGATVINDVRPLGNMIDWTLIAVSAPAILKSGWKLSANAGRLLVGRPAVLKGGQLVSRSRLLLLSRARLNRIVRQTSAKVQRMSRQARRAVTPRPAAKPGAEPAAVPSGVVPAGVPVQSGAALPAAEGSNFLPAGGLPRPVLVKEVQLPSFSLADYSSVPAALRTELNAPLLGRVFPHRVGAAEPAWWAWTKAKARYSGGLVADYFKATARTNMGRMNAGLPFFPSSQAWHAARSERLTRMAQTARAETEARQLAAARYTGYAEEVAQGREAYMAFENVSEQIVDMESYLFRFRRAYPNDRANIERLERHLGRMRRDYDRARSIEGMQAARDFTRDSVLGSLKSAGNLTAEARNALTQAEREWELAEGIARQQAELYARYKAELETLRTATPVNEGQIASLTNRFRREVQDLDNLRLSYMENALRHEAMAENSAAAASTARGADLESRLRLYQRQDQ